MRKKILPLYLVAVLAVNTLMPLAAEAGEFKRKCLSGLSVVLFTVPTLLGAAMICYGMNGQTKIEQMKGKDLLKEEEARLAKEQKAAEKAVEEAEKAAEEAKKAKEPVNVKPETT